MRYVITPLLILLCTLPQGRGEVAVSAPAVALSAQQQAESELLGIAENFNGTAALQRMRELLGQGVSPNAQDTAGDTPILLMCSILEHDYRYLHDAHFAQEVNAAFELLLSHGADAMHENNAGCNALFFMQSKPELLQALNQKKLLPKELSIRIPYDTLALNRYMRLRVQQANYTTHAECRHYLSRKYCAPAYDRVEKKLKFYLSCESRARIPNGAIADCLAFLRLADEARATAYVDNLVYWQHSEHFIEEIPAAVLEALHSIYWNVNPDKLKLALTRLQELLPKEGEDMISINSARPMVLVLEILERQEGKAILPLIQKYTASRDPELAYHAYRLLLRQNNLPAPEPKELEALFGIDPANPEAAPLNETKRKLYECARVDEAMRTAKLGNINAEELQRVANHFRAAGLTPYADAVEMLLEQGKLSQDPYIHQAAHHRYQELVSPAPRVSNARYILEHPGEFSTQATRKP